MSTDWSYGHWRPGGERTCIGDLCFDSTIHCGAGADFEEVRASHVRCRARAGLAPYSWRLHLRIESPGDGRELTLEAADFNHGGQQLWQEGAAVISTDGETWRDLGTNRIELVPWTPTGIAAEDESIDDGCHPPYGVRFTLVLDVPVLYFATPTPYTLQHCADHCAALAARCDFFAVEELCRPPWYEHHGHPLRLVEVARPGSAQDRLRVVVIAGEHAAESAGMYACEGLLEELLRTTDLLSDFSFWVVPVVNVDGVAFGRTYHAFDAGDPVGPGVNLNRDWGARSQPGTRALRALIEQVRPHLFLSLHNGRHRRECEVLSLPHPHLSTLMRHLRAHVPLPVERWRPACVPGMGSFETRQSGLADMAICFETLLLRKAPGCDTFADSYRRVGVGILRGAVAALREIHSRPHFRCFPPVVDTCPARFDPARFAARLPGFFYSGVTRGLSCACCTNVEVNGLPLAPGVYDVLLRVRPGVERISVGRFGGPVEPHPVRDGLVRLTSVPVEAHKLSMDVNCEQDSLPLLDGVICREGMSAESALATAVPYDAYRRDIRAAERHHLGAWGEFYHMLMREGFGAAELTGMHDDLVAWVLRRQVCDRDNPHAGAIRSEEDKYDARDAAAACALFARLYRITGDSAYRERAELARSYVVRNQMVEPGNGARHGGFVHMVRGIWGCQFTRLAPPYPGIDGVDTCVIIHFLCRALDLGLPLRERDADVLRLAAGWVAANEVLPGVFLHHEGARQDCQNMNALAVSALVRAYHTLSDRGLYAAPAWLDAAARGLSHYLSGQEAIGVWPYLFARVGERGQAFAVENIPDHGIGLYHLTRVLDRHPVSAHPALGEALKRAARWYLCMVCRDGHTIDLDYDRRSDLGNDICFSGFTWCRFTAAATLMRVSRWSDEAEPWRHLALRLMEHVREKRWQTADSERAPVVAHARPEAKLATWCQTAEWDAVMLGEMLEDLGSPGRGHGN